MKRSAATALTVCAAAAAADTSCRLSPVTGDAATTLLVRDLGAGSEAAVLVGGRTLIFDCPAHVSTSMRECYGQTEAPMNAPTQLNIAARTLDPGALVVVTTRNLFFGRNKLLATNRRHTAVHVFTVESCETF